MDRSRARRLFARVNSHLALSATFIDLTYTNAWQPAPLIGGGYAMFGHLRVNAASRCGVTDTFVAIQASGRSAERGVERGYNTDYTPLTSDSVLTDIGNTAHSLTSRSGGDFLYKDSDGMDENGGGEMRFY